MERIPKPGEFYRHFKNKMYQILAIASHSETGEQMVVYQALYGSFGVYVRPLAMFLEEVDRKKYPEAAQRHRFEPVSLSEKMAAGENDGPERSVSDKRLSAEDEPNPLLMAFLDADSFEEKYNLLLSMKGNVGQREVDSLCLCLDVTAQGHTLEETLDYLGQCIKMQQKFDAPRLRRS